jgi:hypothetical protein
LLLQRWSRYLIVPLVLLAFVALPGNAALAPRANFGTSPAQCANRENGPDSPINDCIGAAWINGNLNSNKSLYREGDFVPFRTPITGLLANRTYTRRAGRRSGAERGGARPPLAGPSRGRRSGGRAGSA